MMDQETRVKRAHIAMMKHPETALYSGVMMMGKTSITDKGGVTAYTDGINKVYGRKFLEVMCPTDKKVAGLVLHENLHIALRHVTHNKDLFLEDRECANQAADHVVNNIIVSMKDKSLVELPEGGCCDPRFAKMNMREVYRILREEKKCKGKQPGKKPGDKGNEKGNSGTPGGEPVDNGQPGEDEGDEPYQFDEHDTNGIGDGPDDIQEIERKVDRALREGALLAGRLGMDIPRAITEMFESKVDWRKELMEFVAATTKGKDEYTWRQFNRRQLANDIYMPTLENETIGEIVVAIDTSGSIGEQQLNEFATELVSICEVVNPEKVRILWWDTMVHGEQVFDTDYDRIGKMLKPQGGGGTRVGCVSEYINKHDVKAECVIVFTDGYVEGNPEWDIEAPTLWMVTHNHSWTPPAGQMVKVEF